MDFLHMNHSYSEGKKGYNHEIVFNTNVNGYLPIVLYVIQQKLKDKTITKTVK